MKDEDFGEGYTNLEGPLICKNALRKKMNVGQAMLITAMTNAMKEHGTKVQYNRLKLMKETHESLEKFFEEILM